MRCSPAGACRRSARCGCWPRWRCCAALGVHWPWPLVLLAAAVRGHAARPLGAAAAGLLAVVRGGGAADGSGQRRRRPAVGAAGAHAGCAAALRAGCAPRRVATLGLAPLSAGVLPAGVAGRLHRQPAGDSAGHAGHHAAGAARRAAARRCGRWPARWCRRWWPCCRCWPRWPFGLWTAAAAPAWAHGGRPARRRAAACCRCRGGCACWRCRLLLPLLAPPLQRPAAGRVRGGRRPTSARARRCWCARATHLLVYDAGPRYSRRGRRRRSACCCRCCARAAKRASTC